MGFISFLLIIFTQSDDAPLTPISRESLLLVCLCLTLTTLDALNRYTIRYIYKAAECPFIVGFESCLLHFP